MLPAHRSNRIGGRDTGRNRRRTAGFASIGAPGTVDRRRRGGGDGAQEARGLFLMVAGAGVAGQRDKDLLRFLTCGSVDDGKSTLIGRLLYDSKLVFDDQLSSLAKDSKRHGTTGDDIDLALLVDGLEAEREQGITIDVAHRFFTTPIR